MNKELEMMKLRMRLAESEFPEGTETILHGEGRTSTIRGTEAERLRLKMFLLENRRLLYGRRQAVGLS